MSGSPKKRNNDRDQNMRSTDDGLSPVKTVSDTKVRHLVGSNPVNPMTKD